MYTIYTKQNCTYCDQAKSLLSSKDLPFEEIAIDVGQPKEEGKTYILLEDFKNQYPNQRAVPLILEDGKHVGGFSDLKRRIA